MRGDGAGPDGVTWRRNGQLPAVSSSAAPPTKTAEWGGRPGADPCARPTAMAKRDVLKTGPQARGPRIVDLLGLDLALADAVAGETADLDVLAGLGRGLRHDLADGDVAVAN